MLTTVVTMRRRTARVVAALPAFPGRLPPPSLALAAASWDQLYSSYSGKSEAEGEGFVPGHVTVELDSGITLSSPL